MDSAIADEIGSINAIYAEDTLQRLSDDPVLCALSIPDSNDISLRLEFPLSYPDAPPFILGTQSVGDTVAKGEGQHIVEIARTVLAQVFTPGVPCIYDLLEDLGAELRSLQQAESARQEDQQAAAGHGQETAAAELEPWSDSTQSTLMPGEEPPWVLSEVVAEKKSVFVARAAAVSSPDEAKSFLKHLLAADKKVSKATHNITAWRIQGANDTAYQDCDDDGETAAGGRVLHLMQLMDVWNVMVVVTRWYGGVQLGPDRFRIINIVARDAFTSGGFVKESHTPQKSDAGKKKGKK